jgi:hypothetical protein
MITRLLVVLGIVLSIPSLTARADPNPYDFWTYTLRSYLEKDLINVAQAQVFSARREVVVREELFNMYKILRERNSVTLEELETVQAEYQASLHKVALADSRLTEAQIIQKVTDLRLAWSTGQAPDVAALEALTREFRRAQCNSINERLLKTQAYADAASIRTERYRELNRTRVVARETFLKVELAWLVLEDEMVADRASIAQCNTEGFSIKLSERPVRKK